MLNPEKFISLCPADLHQNIALSRPLSSMTTLQIGGEAALVCEVRTPEEARRFQDICHKFQESTYILGAGSNILADDAGYPGPILHIATQNFDVQSDTICAGAGLDFDDLIVRSLGAGLSGLEFASGIPGTLGGALVGNAGCYGHEIGEFLVDALILRQDGTLERTGPQEFGFAYRQTALRESGDIVLEATLRLQRGNVDAAAAVRAEKIADRRFKHPVNLPSAGSWFRNLPPEFPGGRRRPAGHLLELVGAKEMHEGDARVFSGHANMIVNAGGATSEQVRTLASRMRRAVQEKFGVELVEEVRYLPAT